MKLSVVIPVYNEINTILEILRWIRAVPIEKEIIIVDDCSTDGTKEVLKEIREDNIRVFFNDKNMGKGFSIRKGFEYTTGDIIIIQDADLEYYPDEYPILIQKIDEGKADVVYGTRFLGTHRIFYFYHYLGNQVLNFIANILYNTNLSDLMTCYKVFRADALKKLNLRANGFGIEAEITAQVFKRKLRVYEVPISYNGREYDEGKKITWKDFFRSVYWLIKCKFESYDIGEDTLSRMKLMKNNNQWIFEQIKPYLGADILEIGSGIGTISKFIVPLRKNLTLTDIKETYLEYLRYRFIGNPKVRIFPYDISSENLSVLPSKIDTVLCVNVLEHIENENTAIKNIYKILDTNGRLILVVPALKIIHGSLDENLGHFRRYEKIELINKLEQNNFIIEKISYHNLISSIGWFINGRVLKKKLMSSIQIGFLDKFIPVIAKAEGMVTLPFGLSLIVVCRKNKHE